MYWIKQYVPIKDTMYNDDVLLRIHYLSGALISLTFIMIGILCILLSKKNIQKNTAYFKMVVMSRAFGFFLLTCGLSRGIEVISLWYNYSYICGIIKSITGLSALFALLYIPVVSKAIKEAKTLEEIEKSLKDTNKKLDKLENIIK